ANPKDALRDGRPARGVAIAAGHALLSRDRHASAFPGCALDGIEESVISHGIVEGRGGVASLPDPVGEPTEHLRHTERRAVWNLRRHPAQVRRNRDVREALFALSRSLQADARRLGLARASHDGAVSPVHLEAEAGWMPGNAADVDRGDAAVLEATVNGDVVRRGRADRAAVLERNIRGERIDDGGDARELAESPGKRVDGVACRN